MPSLLSAWTNFYVVIATCAGAFIGLQFVVMSLMRGFGSPTSMTAIRAFGTPTVVHFSISLLIAAILLAPWNAFGLALETPILVATLGICGFLCALYIVRTIWHARAANYDPDLEDWAWYIVLPLVAYLVLMASGIAFYWIPVQALFGAALAAISLLFIGIHNAWDTVTYISTRPERDKHLTEGE